MRIVSGFHLTPKYLLEVGSLTSACIHSVTPQIKRLCGIGQVNLSDSQQAHLQVKEIRPKFSE